MNGRVQRAAGSTFVERYQEAKPTMWHAIGILLIGAQGPAVVAADGFDPNGIPLGGQPASGQPEFVGGPLPSPMMTGPPGFESGLMPGEQPIYAADYASGACDASDCGSGSLFTRPCFFDSYWDFTGQRSPSDYAGTFGYGPDWCNTWNARVEWLLWFSEGRNVPPLVNTFTSIEAGQPVGNRTTFGNDEIGENLRHGARFTLGRYLGDTGIRAEGRFWGLEDGSESFVIGDPQLIRPFINALTGLPANSVIANPGTNVNGSIDILAKNDLIGADAWLRRTWWDNGHFRLEGLAGYQFTRMDDSLRVQSDTTIVVPGPPAFGTRQQIQDVFATHNEFHGGSIGLVADARKGALSFEVLGKLAFGNIHERVSISGRTIATPPAGPATTFAGGLLALSSNSGTFERNQFAVVPELNANMVVHISPAWRVTAGYSLLYLSDVLLAGDQIDRRINTTLIPGFGPAVGPASPIFVARESNFLVQGINLGVDYRW